LLGGKRNIENFQAKVKMASSRQYLDGFNFSSFFILLKILHFFWTIQLNERRKWRETLSESVEKYDTAFQSSYLRPILVEAHDFVCLFLFIKQ